MATQFIKVTLIGALFVNFAIGQSAPNSRKISSFTEKVAGIKIKMVAVQGGTFTMGCTSEQGNQCEDDEKPAHQVRVDDYFISKFEITNAQFVAFLNEKGNLTEDGKLCIYLQGQYGEEMCRITKSGNGFIVEPGFENYPVIFVTWYGAWAYCEWLSQKTGKKYRLPTEAEWEYAARGGKKAKGFMYAGSENIDEVAWYAHNSGYKAQPVGKKKPNELKIFDMSGNVSEWCADWYDEEFYAESSDTNPTGPDVGDGRVVRGGGWADLSADCRVSIRNYISPDFHVRDLGFRVVLVP